MLRLIPYTNRVQSLHLYNLFISESESYSLQKFFETQQFNKGAEFFSAEKYVFTVQQPGMMDADQFSLTSAFNFTYQGTYDPRTVTIENADEFMRVLAVFDKRKVFQAGCYFHAKCDYSSRTQYDLYIFTCNMVVDKQGNIDVIDSPSNIIGKGRFGITATLAGRIEPEFGLFGEKKFKVVEQLVKLQSKADLGSRISITGSRFSALIKNEDRAAKKVTRLKYKKTRFFGHEPYFIEMSHAEVATPVVKSVHAYSKMKFIKGWTLQELYIDEPENKRASSPSPMEDVRQFLLTPEGRFVVIFALLNAKCELEKMGLVHGDIKADNVMVEYVPQAKGIKVIFIDFGHSVDITIPGHEAIKKMPVGAPLFSAPEALLTGKSSYASDMFSIFLLISEILGDKVLRKTYSRYTKDRFIPLRKVGGAIDVRCFECEELKDLSASVKSSLMKVIQMGLKVDAEARMTAVQAEFKFRDCFAELCQSLTTSDDEKNAIEINITAVKSVISNLKSHAIMLERNSYLKQMKEELLSSADKIKTEPVAWRAYCQALGISHLISAATPALFTATCHYYFNLYDKSYLAFTYANNCLDKLYNINNHISQNLEFKKLWRKLEKFRLRINSSKPNFDEMLEQAGEMTAMTDLLIAAIKQYTPQALVESENIGGKTYVPY